jgi:uncharacterized protein DUF1302
MKATVLVLVCVLCVLGGNLFAQTPDGYVSVGLDALPNAPGTPIELRARLFADEKLAPLEHLTLRAAASLDVLGLRSGRESRGGGSHRLALVPSELHAEFTGQHADLRLGYSRVVWGRLDEVQPTDVVNPLDLARFFFDGRSEARLAVPMVRGRVFFGERASIEAIVVPQFRRGRFDLLDEVSSPFNGETGTVPVSRREPAIAWHNLQGGGRFSATTRRVDWAATFYRGFDAFGTYIPAGPQMVLHVFPRYTMVGGDFETTRGRWALRGEVARFSGGMEGVDGGIGLDRRAGEIHVSGTVLVHHESPPNAPQLSLRGGVPAGSYTAASIVAAADRSFARERYRTRTFAVYNATERATFVRNITSMEVRANVSLEGSIGWFFGAGTSRARRDVIGQFSDRDFLYARLRVHF